MPIRPENKARYPENWAEIRAAVLVRAGHRCEHAGCGVPNYAVGWWRLVPSTGPVWEPVTGHAQPASHAEARRIVAEHADCAWQPLTIIVLTVAHLDHTPENCAPHNLRAWCQRHHLAYDQQQHCRTAYATRKAFAQTVDMFDAPQPVRQHQA